jgi:ribonuclease HI
MGYNCNSPKEVIYGPRELFGLGNHDYYIEQGIKQLTALAGHVRQDSETSRMMRIELHWCQVQAGTEQHLLGNPTDLIDYIETCWIMSIRDFLRTYNLSVDFTVKTLPTVQCSGDEFIMDGIQLRSGCTATELQQINACRMFLQVSRVSDISSANGRFLRRDVLMGKATTYFQSVTRWPRQGRPPREWWSLWCKGLKRAFSKNGSSADLRVPLCHWNSDLQQGEWETLFSVMSGSSEVFQRRNDGEYDVYTDLVGTRGNHYYVSDTVCGRVDRLPIDAAPAELEPTRKDGRRRVSCRQRLNSSKKTGDVGYGSFGDYVKDHPAHIQHLLCEVDLSDATAAAVARHVLTAYRLHCGSDGRLLNGKGTFGFVWADRSSMNVLISGRGQVPGYVHGMSSTQTELCGIYAALCYVHMVTKYFLLVLPRRGMLCTIYCDSKAALQRVRDLTYSEFGTTWRCRANYDLEAAIRQSLTTPGLQVTWEWVRGHAGRRKNN